MSLFIYYEHNTCWNCDEHMSGIVLCMDPEMMAFCSRRCFEVWESMQKKGEDGENEPDPPRS